MTRRGDPPAERNAELSPVLKGVEGKCDGSAAMRKLSTC